ncbi:MAG TPA: ThiF family adenylyltransferase [Candidatus Baltobacteraceae bacterium]|jgi:adenylyltransferase/sulfurtransferase|nr:ThiF family adenylyltransferase [Candidatus Baltobacteraceae bacterium]
MAERTTSANDLNGARLLAGRRELRRYSRHLLIPEVGLAGQERLASSRVLCVGAGGLGAPVLAYLAAAGVGRITIIDDDIVEESNLQRQVIFGMRDLGRPKALAAAERLHDLNPHVELFPLERRFDATCALELVEQNDLVIDATDSFASRYLINDAARLRGKPDVYASIFRFDGQVSVFAPGGPCYRCLFPIPPPEGSVPTCAEGGALGVLAGIIGTLQAGEVLKLLLGIGRPLIGRLALVDALETRVREYALERDPSCPLCGDAPTITDLREESQPCIVSTIREIAAHELDVFLAENPQAILLDVREPHEIVLGMLPGAIHLPVSELEARLHELDSTRTYIVACRLGRKSPWVAQRLIDAGFGNVVHLQDGLLARAALDASINIL